MLLSELLRLDDFQKAKIEMLGSWKTANAEYAVLGRQGQPLFPIRGIIHLVDTTRDSDPDIPVEEEYSIRRRFGVRVPPFRTPTR